MSRRSLQELHTRSRPVGRGPVTPASEPSSESARQGALSGSVTMGVAGAGPELWLNPHPALVACVRGRQGGSFRACRSRGCPALVLCDPCSSKQLWGLTLGTPGSWGEGLILGPHGRWGLRAPVGPHRSWNMEGFTLGPHRSWGMELTSGPHGSWGVEGACREAGRLLVGPRLQARPG